MIGTFRKIWFWFQSKNRHGVHSPFIYNFLDQGLYTPHISGIPRENRLLRATVEYFKPGKTGCIGNGQLSEFLKQLDIKLTQETRGKFDLFVFEKPSESVEAFLSTPENWHNDSIVYIGNIRVSVIAYTRWKEIIKHSEVRIVLETYSSGLLFFRKEQACEHFRIRT